MSDTPEQEARDLLERLGHPGAQELTSGDVVELANLLAWQLDARELDVVMHLLTVELSKVGQEPTLAEREGRTLRTALVKLERLAQAGPAARRL